MNVLLLPAFLLLAAGEPTENPPGSAHDAPAQQSASQAKSDTAKVEEPKMVCRNERVTGSRVAKERVCRPVGGSHADLDSATQRDLGLNRNAPMAMPEGVSAGPVL